MTAAELSKKILDKAGKNSEWLSQAIGEKQTRFSGLLTDEGALEIIAKEHGVSQPSERVFTPVSLSSLSAGDSASVRVRATQIFAPKVFRKNDRSGKVCNVSIADETTKATLVLWNDDVDKSWKYQPDCTPSPGNDYVLYWSNMAAAGQDYRRTDSFLARVVNPKE